MKDRSYGQVGNDFEGGGMGCVIMLVAMAALRIVVFVVTFIWSLF